MEITSSTTILQLREYAKELGLKNISKLNKKELMELIQNTIQQKPIQQLQSIETTATPISQQPQQPQHG